MEIRSTVYHTTGLFVLFFTLIFLAPEDTLAELSQQQIHDKLAQVDVILSNDKIQIQSVRKSLSEISVFSGVARSWFVKLARKEADIKASKAELEGVAHSSYTNRIKRINEDIKRHVRARDDIMQLNGEVVYSYFGKACTTMGQLRNEFNGVAQESIRLNNEHKTLMNDIQKQNAERDRLTLQLESMGGGRQARLDGYKERLETMEKDYQFYHELANDPNIWYMPAEVEPIYIPRDIAILYITKTYQRQLKNSGGKYDPEELSRRIKNAQQSVLAIKDQIRKETLPNLAQKIEKLKQQISSAKTSVMQLSGCWLLTIGKSTSIIHVTKDINNVYHGTLSVNKLEYYQTGDEVFTVRQISPNTFTGMENAYTPDGQFVRNKLKIVIHSKGDSLTYSSDSSVSMRRCP